MAKGRKLTKAEEIAAKALADQKARQEAAARAAAAAEQAGGEAAMEAATTPGVTVRAAATPTLASDAKIAEAIAAKLAPPGSAAPKVAAAPPPPPPPPPPGGGGRPPFRTAQFNFDPNDPPIKVYSFYYDQPPITPADRALMLQAKIDRLVGQPSGREFMPAEVGGMPSVVDGTPFDFELGGPGGESLLDFENPNPPPQPPQPQPSWMPPEGGEARSVTQPSTYDVRRPVEPIQPQAETPKKKGEQSKEAEKPAKPKTPYSLGNSYTMRGAKSALGYIGPRILPAASKLAGGALDLTAGAALGTLGLGAAYRVARPLISEISQYLNPQEAGAAPPQAPAQAAPAPAPAPQAMPPQQQGGGQPSQLPPYLKELQDSMIGDRNSADIIRSLSKIRGMA